VTSEKSPDQIEKDMEQTRESITEKVSLLENQVLGITSSVTDTVQAVKDAVTAAPTAVSDTVKQTIESVKDSVRETVGSFSVSECVRDNPWSALGTTTVAGFLAGYFFGGRGGMFSRPIMAQGHDAPASYGRVGAAHTAYNHETPAAPRGANIGGGLFSGLFAMVGQEIHQLAEQALSTAVASLKQSISTQVPQMVDTAVQGMTERVACAVSGQHDDTTRVGGPGYSATAPAAGG